MTATPHESKQKILKAALDVVRSKGYAATTVDDVCREAGVTKGSFFHHFKSKDEMTVCAIEFWNEMTGEFFASAPYHRLTDPLERVIGYIDFRAQLLQGELRDFTCFLGTLVQETYDTHPQIRTAADAGMRLHIAELTRDIEAAKALYALDASWAAESVGYFIQSVLQGAFIFAKATQSSKVVSDDLAHLKQYLKSLFNQR